MKLLLPAGIGLFAIAACSGPAPAPPTAEPAPAATPAASPTIEPVPPSVRVAPRPGATPNPPAPDGPKLAVEAEGLRWFLPPNGTAGPIPFGRPEGEVLASLERLRGRAGTGMNQDCGAGPVRYANWADGLSLVFQGGRFAGWSLDGRAAGALATADGIGPGSTRAALEAAFGIPVVVRPSSLGTEWTTGTLSGLLDGPGPRAKITDMWAGVNCVAR